MDKACTFLAAFALIVAVGTSTAHASAAWTALSGAPDLHHVLLVHDGHATAAQASGVVNAVDAARHRVNLSHGSITALGWPAMTMDFAVSPEVDLAALRAGMKVTFTLVRAADGAWVVDAIQPRRGR